LVNSRSNEVVNIRSTKSVKKIFVAQLSRATWAGRRLRVAAGRFSHEIAAMLHRGRTKPPHDGRFRELPLWS
jgi:hypothetical protein